MIKQANHTMRKWGQVALAAVLAASVLVGVAPSPVSAGSVPLDTVATPPGASNLSSNQFLAVDGDTAVVVVGTGVASVLQVLDYSNGAWSERELITTTLSLASIPNVNGVDIDDDVIVAGTNSGIHTWDISGANAVAGFEEFNGGTRVGSVAIDATAMFSVEDGSTLIERYNRTGAAFVKGTPLTSGETLRSATTRIAIDDSNGRTLAVGIPTGQTSIGEVEIFENLAGGVLAATPSFVLANPAPVGNGFGSSVAVGPDGSVAVGYSFADTQQGAAYVFRRVGAALVQLPRVVPTVRRANGEFGTSVALDGDVLLVGEPAPNDIGQSGRAVAFEYDLVTDQFIETDTFIEPFNSNGNDFAEGLALTPLPFGDPGSLALFGVESGVGGGPEGVVAAVVGQPEAADKLISGRAEEMSEFGTSVSMSGSWAAVGQPEIFAPTNPAGRVEILERDGLGDWTSVQSIDPPGFVTGANAFGTDVALDGNVLAVLYANSTGNELTIYERADSLSPFALAETFAMSGLAPAGSIFTAVAVNGTRVAAVARGAGAADATTLRVFNQTSLTNWAVADNITPPGTSSTDLDVAIDGDLIAVGMPSEANGGNPNSSSDFVGAVHVFVDTAGTWSTSPVSTLRAPDFAITGDLRFGTSVTLHDDTLLVGAEGAVSAGSLTGAAWFYEHTVTPGVFDAPQGVVGSNAGSFQFFGTSVGVWGDRAIIGERDQSNPGAAHVFTRRNGVWQQAALLQAPDAAFEDEFFGRAVDIDQESILVGSPGDTNSNGITAGAVYWFESVTPTGNDAPILTIDVTGPGATVTAGASGIAVNSLPARNIDGYGGDDSNVVSTSLEAVDGATDAGVAEVLTETTVADLGLGGAGTDGIGRELVESILLSDVVIDGGWEPVLVGSVFEGLPLQNVTLGQVLDAGLIDGRPLEVLDLSATPIGSIPIGSIALAETVLDDITLPGGQSWCDLLGAVSPGYDCTTTPAADPANDSLIDLAIQGTPIGSIPIGSIPIGSIPIGSIPIGSIPIGSIDIEASPIGSIPIGSIDIGSTPIGSIPIGSIPIGSIPIGSIDVGSTPIGSIPIGSITIGEIALGDLSVVPGVAASPIGSIPIGSIDLQAAPIGSIPIGSIPIGSIPIGSIPIGSIPIGSIPIGSIPIGSIDLAASPIGSIPIGSIPIGSIPIGSIPIGSIPIGSIPIGSIPIGSIPIGSIPIGSIDLTASPIGSIPIGSIPVAQRATIVDCSLIDCTQRFDLADAFDAGALLPGATLAGLEDVPTGVRLSDLVGVDGLDRAAIEAQLASLIASPAFDTLSDFSTTDDLTLAELPANAPEVSQTDVGDLVDALDTVSLADLLAAVGADEAALRAELTRAGIIELNDLTDTSGMVLGDLPSTRSEFIAQPVTDLLAAMTDVRLGDLLALHPTLDASDVNWGASTLADITGWQDVTLAELTEYDDTSLAELVDALNAATSDELTFGEVLLSLVGVERHDWTDVKLGSIELENATGAQTFTSGFEVVGGIGIDRTVTIRSTIPDDAVYAAGTTVIRAGDSGTLPGGAGEPTIDGNQLVWTLSGVRSAVRYEIDIDVVSALSLGTNTVGTTGAIVGLGIGATGFTSVGVQQAFEPNDVPTDVGVVDVVSGSIYASHIATSTDVDLFAIDLPAGARLSVALSDLPADYDLVVYGPPVQALAPPLRQIEPSEPPLLTLDPTVNDDGGALLQDVPLLDRPVVGVSSSRSTDNESVVINSVRSAGTYYVQVSGYSGASSNQPYALYIASDAPAAPLVCAAQDYQSVADRGTLPGVGELIGVNTIVLVNRERLVGKYGSNASVALDAVDDLVTYTNVTNPALGTNAVVVEVDGDDDVRAAFDAYDAASCEPGTANDVVAEINELVDTIDAADPATALTQILIVGDDDVIPMARIADDTTIANERTYASTFIDSTANSLFGALSTGHFLSDDPYGDADPIRSGDRILYVTDVGLGRLVETPAEIAGQVAAFIGFEGLLDPSTALVTGYDFLTDGSNAIVDELDALPDTTSVTEIINESWTASDVIDGLFPAIGESPNIASINAHFDHYRALPADQNASGSESDLFTTADVNLAARQNRLVGRSLFSMGCHGGLSVPDELFPGTTDGIALDWAQAFARQDAIWVGNTGFGYGETEGVELSERLMALYASRLDGSVNAGEALLYAKQEYLGTQQATYGAFDEKVLQQTVFYGIPFYNVDVVDEPAAAPIPPRPATEAVPGTDLRVNTIEVAPDFTSETNVGGVVYSADLPAGTPGAAGEQSTPFAPILPTASFDVSDVDPTGVAPETVAQGAVITGLVTTDVTGVDPDLARPIVDDSNVETEPRVGNISTDPELFVSSFATPEGPRQSLTATLSTFRSTSPDGSGTQRLFDELEVETYFRTPGDDADQARPTFREVRSSTTDIGGQQVLVIDAIVADDLPDNMLRVFALVAVDPGASTEWTLVEMIRLGGDRWSGSLPIGSGDVEYLVQAIDSNGNAALSTNKARGFDAVSEQSPVGGDIEVVYSVTPGVVFAGPVTLTATAGGAVVDSQLNGGLVVAGSASTVVTLDPAVIGEGAHTVVFSTESGAQRTEVLVFDDTAPVANIISPVEAATVEGGAGGRLRYSCADAATGVASCVGLLDGQPVASGSLVPAGLGSKTLVVTATDVAGMTSSAQSTFSVADTVDPVVSVPGDITVPTDPGASSAVVSFTATATDNDPSPSLSCTPASGAAFVFGTTQVTCTATDAAGNIGSGSFDVIVTDDTVPVLTMPDDIVSSTDPGQATAVVTFADPLVFDNLATTVSCDAVSGSVFSLGMTEITCSATDAAGNAASDSFFVTVIDGEAPVIASVDDVSAVASTSAGVAVSYDSPVVSDNVDVSSTATCVPVSGSTFNVGDTTVTCDVSDSAGNAAVSVEFTVSVTLAADTSDPVVSVPADISVSAEVGVATAVVTFSASSLDESPSGQTMPVPVCVPASGSVFSLGTTEVTCTATDAASNSGSASFDVTVTDDEIPVIAATDDASAVASTSAGVAVSFATPSASDNSGETLTAVCAPQSGSTFNVGDTTVTCDVSDSAGNAAVSVEFTVSVTLAADTSDPVVSVPADISVSAEVGVATAVVTFSASSLDESPSGQTMPVPVCVPASGSVFSLGTTEVTCTATDAASNSGSASFDVTVTDDEIPVFGVANNQSFEVPLNAGGPVTFVVPTATDNSGTAPTVVCNPVSGSTFTVGSTEVSCTATDVATNSAQVSFFVQVATEADTTDPVLVVPAATVAASTDVGEAFATVSFVATATDDGPAGNVSVVPVCVPASGSQFVIGDTTVTCTATDGASNSVQDTFVVTVTDDENPTFAAAATQNFQVPLSAGGAVTFVVPAASDNSGVAPTVVCDPLSGSVFAIGTTEVTCTATDAGSNSVDVSFDVVVTVGDDTTDPVLVVPTATVAASTDVGEAFATVSFVATATDDGPAGNVSVVPVCVPASGSQFVIGDTTVTCTATDGASNSVQDTFTVTVADDEDPTFAAAPDQSFEVPLAAGGVVTFVAPTASDNSGVSPTVVCAPLSGSSFAVGSTEVTCTATDIAGNTGSVAFDVILTVGLDTTTPVVTVPGAAVEAATLPGETTAVVTFAAAATDTGPTGTVDVPVVCVPASGTSFAVGDTVVTCTATDGAGNPGSESFTVSVTATPAEPVPDTVPPVIELPGGGAPVSVETEPGASFAIVTFEVSASDLGIATAAASSFTDVDEPIETAALTEIEVTCTPASGSRFSIGTTTVECSATDAAGNTGTASFEVRVSDVEPPKLTAPDGDRVRVTSSVVGPVDFPVPTVEDNSGEVVVVCDPAPGSNFDAGTTTVTCTATDSSGNESTVSFGVEVELRDPNTPGPSGDLPATGGGGIDLRPAWIVLAVGLLLLVTSRRRRRLRVLQH